MSSLIKFGTITKIVHINPTSYEVQLDDQNIVTIKDGQIQPSPSILLKPGTRLSVYEINGVVKWASMNLPDTNETQQESIFIEEKPVIVVEANRYIGVVTLQDSNRSRFSVRIQSSDDIWPKVARGKIFLLKITRSSEAVTYLLSPIPETNHEHTGEDEAQEKNQQYSATNQDEKDSKKDRNQAQGKSGKYETPHADGKGQSQRNNSNRDESIQVGRIGIDPAYFAEREKEGHRYEIMSFLAEHLNDDLIEWYRMRPARPPQYALPVKPVNEVVEDALKSMDRNFQSLYSHQARALDAIRTGRNLVVVTQTASGKTLCYNPAIFEHFLENGGSAHALYIFPLNALMMDQKEKIDEIRRILGTNGHIVAAEVLRGGLGTGKRREIARENPQILATNPELLSWILQEPEYWTDFFSGLKYVVIDEVHTYRGILGLHMAGILRRLLLQAQRLGSKPQFILSSATVSNPLDLAVRLTSLPESSFDLLSEKDDGSIQSHKHWVVINPDSHANGNDYDNYLTTAAMTMIELLTSRDEKNRHSPLNTILFARSIRDVNKIYRILQDNLSHFPALRGKVNKYVSAELSVAEKREIYNGLKSGDLIGVVSTVALEAGIDIGKLDACIIAGFPMSVMSMRQMAGRVGRTQEGLVIFVPKAARSVDQYYRLNPQLLLEQPPEVFVVDPTNAYVARKHINAAAYNLKGLNRRELSVFGHKAVETAQQAVKDKIMSVNQDKYFGTKRSFSNRSDPYAISSIRSQAQTPYAVCKAGVGLCGSPACLEKINAKEKCEDLVATLDQQYAYRDCHPGAIYEGPDGGLYEVTGLDEQKHIIYVGPMAEHSLLRTFVEEDISIKIISDPIAGRGLYSGVDMQVGEVLVTRSFVGYYTYELEPKSNCRRCRKEYEPNVAVCSSCGRKTSRSYGQSKPKRHDFPFPYNETGLHISLKTVACWMKVPAELEGKLYSSSPCKLPGEQNKVTGFLKRPLQMDQLVRSAKLSDDEKVLIGSYHQYAGDSLRDRKSNPQETTLFPGVYGQCVMSSLREKLPESRSLEVFQAVTNYPVTDQLKHVCRKCQTSVLLQAMHTLEHTVLMRYPSVALGDISDLESYTTLGHPDTGMPTIFWYDNYDGGLGAAEKIFEQFQELLVASQITLTSCLCNSLEGCPNCTHIGHCESQNEGLSKIGLLALISLLQGKQPGVRYEPFVYRNTQKTRFESTYRANEYVKQDHGVGQETPQSQPRHGVIDPFELLRVQKEVHDPVLKKAYEVRGMEITNEVPPVSAVELNQAYHIILEMRRSPIWNILPGQDPFKILEVLPAATLPMIQKIYRVIARQIHPDTNTGDKAKANDMMKLVNDAYDKVRKEKRQDYSDNEFDL